MEASKKACRKELRVLYLHLKAAKTCFQAARASDTPNPTRPHLLIVPLPGPSIYKPSHPPSQTFQPPFPRPTSSVYKLPCNGMRLYTSIEQAGFSQHYQLHCTIIIFSLILFYFFYVFLSLSSFLPPFFFLSFLPSFISFFLFS